MPTSTHPVQRSVDYPDRALNRLTTFFRIFTAIPILIVAGTVGGAEWGTGASTGRATIAAAGGLLFSGPLLMIVFRQKYPRWWFDWNLELMRFSARVGVYLALMEDRYPSTDEAQALLFPRGLTAGYRSSSGSWRSRTMSFSHSSTSRRSSWSSSHGSPSFFTGRFPRGAFNFLVGLGAGTTASWPTRSSSSPTATRRSASPPR